MLILRVCGHGGRDKMVYEAKKKYSIPKPIAMIFVSLCIECQKNKPQQKKGLVVKPIIPKDFNSRGQVDLVDLQSIPDGEFKWLMDYQDHATKFTCIRPLRTKQAAEVAVEQLKIFLEHGAPEILQSDNGREFTAEVITELMKLWPQCKMVHGRPRHPESQGSVERCNQDVESMLHCWMEDNQSTKWSLGCWFV